MDISIGKIWDKVKDSFITDQVFWENEVRTNLFVSRVMALFALILVISLGLQKIGVFDISSELMTSVTVYGCIELLIPVAICRHFKGEKRWMKYLLVLEYAIVLARLDSLLTYSVVPLMFIPVILSCAYYSRLFTMQISIVSTIMFAMSAFCSAYFNMAEMDLNFVADTHMGYVRNIMLESFVPKWLAFWIVSSICYEMAKRGRQMVLAQHEISEEQTRVETELTLASRIQLRALPIVHNLPVQEHPTFELAAMMEPAKEVGGDFYDFFYLDPTHLVLMIADVSGKGVPAALFMMVSKIMLDNSIDNGRSPGNVLTEVNHLLCEKGLDDMFVTVWLGVLDLETGLLESASAGHEYPMIAKRGNGFKVFKDKHGFVLGGMDGMRYKETQMQLEPGDILFVYTDGVPEANDVDEKQFGMERTLKALDAHKDGTMEQMLAGVKAEMDAFAKGAPPFDDTTMLALKFVRYMTDSGIVTKADIESFPSVTSYVESQMEEAGVSMKCSHKISIAVDEIYSNIVKYSGADWAQIRCDVTDEKVTVSFADNGLPYNPLESETPDVALALDEREVGGLGIFLTKKLMDDVTYEYVNGQNMVSVSLKR